MPWNQCESVRPLAVDSDKADRLLAYGNACCSYSTGNDVIDGLMPLLLLLFFITPKQQSIQLIISAVLKNVTVF